MFGIAGLTQEDAELDDMAFSIFNQCEDLDEVLRDYNLAISEFEVDLAVIEFVGEEILRVVTYNSITLALYLQEFINVANDNDISGNC